MTTPPQPPPRRLPLGERLKSRDYRKATGILLIVGTILIILYDVLPAASRMLGDTISELTRFWALSWLFIPAGLGVLMGHLMGPLTWRTPGWLSALLIPYGLLTLVACWRRWWAPRHYRTLTILFLLHFAVGAVAWSQGDVEARIMERAE